MQIQIYISLVALRMAKPLLPAPIITEILRPALPCAVDRLIAVLLIDINGIPEDIIFKLFAYCFGEQLDMLSYPSINEFAKKHLHPLVLVPGMIRSPPHMQLMKLSDVSWGYQRIVEIWQLVQVAIFRHHSVNPSQFLLSGPYDLNLTNFPTYHILAPPMPIVQLACMSLQTPIPANLQSLQPPPPKLMAAPLPINSSGMCIHRQPAPISGICTTPGNHSPQLVAIRKRGRPYKNNPQSLQASKFNYEEK